MRADQPSATARLIGRSILLSAHHPEFRVLVPAGEPARLSALLGVGQSTSWFGLALRYRWTRRLLWRIERAILPGIFLHYLARKRWLEHRVVQALQSGVEQVVVLGAGLDTLALRLHREWPHVLFAELDHPATQRVKTLLPARDSNLAFIPADLAQEFPSVVLAREPRYSPARRTCVIAEGVLMYLDSARVVELLRDLAALSADTLAFTFMEPGPDGRAAFRGGRKQINTWLRFVREPFQWTIGRPELSTFLGRCGWNLETVAGAAELRDAILTPAGLSGAALAEGECLALASMP